MRRASARLRDALAAESATAERLRLSRSIHDGVLQVLAQVQRRGKAIGGEAVELAELAAEQEVALRNLMATRPVQRRPARPTSARRCRLATPRVEVVVPAGPVLLPAATVVELAAAVTEAVCNVHKHAGAGARTWIVVEDLGGEVLLSSATMAPGRRPNRLAEAEHDGRLGVSQSIRGRIADLGGTAEVHTAPGEGTEWEMKVSAMTRVMIVDDHPMWREGVARDLGGRGYDVCATAGRGERGPDREGDPAGRGGDGPAARRGLRRRRHPGDHRGAAGHPGAGAVGQRRAGRRAGRGEERRLGLPGQVGVAGRVRRRCTTNRRRRRGLQRRAGRVAAGGVPAARVRSGRRSRSDRARDRGPPAGRPRPDRAPDRHRLVLSHRTVENHVQNTLRKLQLHNRAELVRYAIEHGLDDE